MTKADLISVVATKTDMKKKDAEVAVNAAIEAVIGEVLQECGVKNAKVTVIDKGALDCVIRARVETAVMRGRGE